MATSTITLYRVNFPKDTNCLIDDFATFLLGSFPYIHYNQQYVRNDLDITHKIQLTQNNVNKLNYNYCSVKNDDEDVTFYYFIMNVEQVSPQVLRLTLHMDTVNTLANANEYCSPRNFLSTTEIERQHMDRFKQKANWNPSVGGTLWRNIDRESEGMVPEKEKTYDALLQENVDNLDWYLIYKNHLELGVSAYLCASQDITLAGSIPEVSSLTILPEDLEVGKYYFLTDVDNPYAQWYMTVGGIQRLYTFDTSSLGTSMFTFKTDGTKLYFLHITPARTDIVYRNHDVTPSTDYTAVFGTSKIVNVQGEVDNPDVWTETTQLRFTKAEFFRVSSQDWSFFSSDTVARNVNTTYGLNVGNGTIGTVRSIESVDRTDSALVKIIMLPYCPIAFTYTASGYVFTDTNWKYIRKGLNDGLLQYKGTSLPTFGSSKLNVLLPEMSLNIPPQYITPTLLKGVNKTFCDKLESKMYHSDNRTVKAVYDSFSTELRLEDVNTSTASVLMNTTVPIEFRPTSTINSKFGFKFNINSTNLGSYKEKEDFDNILLVTRNNEETILNSEYLNYIKNGYNYDKKANALQLEQMQRQATAKTVGNVASIVAGVLDVAFGTKVMGAGMIASGITGGIGTANSWANVNRTKELQDNAMQSKLAQLAAQRTSTSGTDDVDLMKWYSDNRLHIMKYEPKELDKERLIHLFDITGYSHHTYDTPNVDSRIWYNYIQCNPQLDYEGTKVLKSEWIDDLKARYLEGVTVFHTRSGNYCLDRQYENYERWIIEVIR